MSSPSYTPRMFAELMDIDVEEATLLYQAYGFQHDEYQPIFGSASEYGVPLADIFLYLFDLSDRGVIDLDSYGAEVTDLRGTLERGVGQLRGENWSRLVLTVGVPVEGEESMALTAKIRDLAESYYGEGNILVVGDITSAHDLAAAYSGDMLKINFLTIAFVFVILLFTLRSVMGPVILVFVIRGSIWMNFSFPYLQDFHTSFVTNMIVSAIQMGATIDYAIVLMNRYLAIRHEEGLAPKPAMVGAVNSSFAIRMGDETR